MQTMNNDSKNEFFRACQTAYYARFPEKSADLINSVDAEHINAMYKLTNDDINYVSKYIANISLTASKQVPGWGYIHKCVENNYKAKVANKTDADLIAMSELSAEDRMYLNITQTMIEDIIPAEELPIKGWFDENILKIIDALYEDGRITEQMRDNGKLGFKALNTEFSELMIVNDNKKEFEHLSDHKS